MIRRTTVLAGTFALVCGAALANAQSASRPRTGAVTAAPQKNPAPQTGNTPRIAIIPPSPPAPAPGFGQAGFGQFTNFIVVPQVVQVYYLPTVVLNDGRVFADFGTGHGYEQVLRKCPVISGTIPPNFAVAPCWTIDGYGRYSVIQQR